MNEMSPWCLWCYLYTWMPVIYQWYSRHEKKSKQSGAPGTGGTTVALELIHSAHIDIQDAFLLRFPDHAHMTWPMALGTSAINICLKWTYGKNYLQFVLGLDKSLMCIQMDHFLWYSSFVGSKCPRMVYRCYESLNTVVQCAGPNSTFFRPFALTHRQLMTFQIDPFLHIFWYKIDQNGTGTNSYNAKSLAAKQPYLTRKSS